MFEYGLTGTTKAAAMITEVRGNLLDADVDALVNTVNTAGVMGKGVALQLKQAFPANYQAYKRACERGEVVLGQMFVFDNGQLTRPRFIVNFPTKQHWRSRSRLSDIEAGLADLVRVIEGHEIKSIAIPALGCGNGGLDWADVEPRIEGALGAVPDVDVRLYPPQRAPAAGDMRVSTKRPRMTAGRAALVGLLHRYVGPGLGVTPIEVQKLMYFLQALGEPLRLNYTRGRYGPYAESLNHVLQAVEGHYLRGYGDRSRPVLETEPIELLAGAVEEAEAFLADYPDTVERFDRVAHLIEGFESPYGLELLATVHWIATNEASSAGSDAVAAIPLVQAWSQRKQRLFGDRHIGLAWSRLWDQGWLPTPT